MQFCNVTSNAVWRETLEQDIESEKEKIKKASSVALNQVHSDLIATLQNHISSDWYEKYTPAYYKRRTDNPSLGVPLGSDENILPPDIQGTRMVFEYLPTGQHQKKYWSIRNGDDLIEWIQKEQGDIKPRPFWNNFVEEAKNGSIINSFVDGMKPFYDVIEQGTGKDVIFGSGESLLPYDEAE